MQVELSNAEIKTINKCLLEFLSKMNVGGPLLTTGVCYGREQQVIEDREELQVLMKKMDLACDR